MMMDMIQLWLPILAAAIGVFVASSLVHMVFKWHNSDFRKLANEEQVQAAIRDGAPARGQYMMPWCHHGDLRDPAMQERFRSGPIATLTVMRSGVPSMGPMLLQWFVLNLVLAKVAAWIGLMTYGLHGDPRYVAHLAGIVTLLAYGAGSIQQAIWMGKPWSVVLKDLLDALIYGVVTAVAFMFLWPHA